MKNWYKRPVTKGLLLLLAHMISVFLAISMMISLSFSGSIGGLMKNTSKPYEDSDSFKSMVYEMAQGVVENIYTKGNFESEGKYNPDKLVDIINMGQTRKISGENESGLAYRLADLENWSTGFKENEEQKADESIVVCQRPDGTYFYYYIDEFKARVQDKKLRLNVVDMSSSNFIEGLESGQFIGGSEGELTIQNEEGVVEYVDCWTFGETVPEEYAPVGASNILEVVNQTPGLNGKLSTIFEYLRSILTSLSNEMERYQNSGDAWEEGNTNLSYMYVDQSIKKVYTNNSRLKGYNGVKENLEDMKRWKNSKYLILSPRLSEFDTNMDVPSSHWRGFLRDFNFSSRGNYIFAVSVDTKFPIQDGFYEDKEKYNTYAPYLRTVAIGSIVCWGFLFVIIIWITLIAGRNGKNGEVQLHAFDRWKTEIAAVGVTLLWYLPVMFLGSNFPSPRRINIIENMYMDTKYRSILDLSYSTVHLDRMNLVLMGAFALFTMACFLIGYLSLVRRIKARTVWENSLLRSILVFLEDFWKNRSVTFRATLILVTFILLHWLGFGEEGWLSIAMVLSEGAAVYFVVKGAIAKSRIKKGIREISNGNVNYQISLERLTGENQVMAVMVNDIASGLQRAVEEGMKSERLKTDLITNVSHDIKTPLTSIINYVALLKREDFENPKIQGYLDILETKAQRLKTLTEDVVEASKVSSGNIVLEFMDVNLVEMINQTAGEFAEKFEHKGLEMIQNLPDETAVIHVDGKRMWRILENIYNNAAKYAMPGTRVYSDLQVRDDRVSFSLKNISQHPLNISEDELTERFIRGDISRGTEGSGLGLSIAKSLTKMQEGEFKLYLDGDLFKVTIEFPRVK